MTGHEYEHVVAKYLRNKGYSRVKVTKASGDYGVDVIAHKGKHKYAVQCKYYSSPVGVGAVQEAVAGKAMYGCDRAMVVTNSTFTAAAEKLAKANNVELISGVNAASGVTSGCAKIFWWIVGAIIVITTVVEFLKWVVGRFTNHETRLESIKVAAIIAAPFIIYGLVRLLIWIIKRKKQNEPLEIPEEWQSPSLSNTSTVINARPHSAPPLDPNIDIRDFDELLPEAVDLILEIGEVSTTKLQRHFVLGYPRASQLISQMEQIGCVGPFNGSMPRQVTITKEEWAIRRKELFGTSPKQTE